jgi:hypothetical protein
MPLFLTKELELQWLQADTDEQLQAIMDFQMPSEELLYHPVYTIRSSKPRPDDKRKFEPYVWTNLPELVIV